MAQPARNTETHSRRTTMLRTAFCPVVRAALEDPSVIEIMANPDGSVWLEQVGLGLTVSDDSLSAGDRERVIRLVASSVGGTASSASPIISAELPDGGERFEGLLPPVSTQPCFSIRKPTSSPFNLQDYVDQGSVAPPVAQSLKASIQARQNILIAGGTSSGKTTFANALLSEPGIEQDRIVILEDTRELNCQNANKVQLRTRGDQVTLRDLVRSTLRLRPDRIIVGEVRGPEALDLLKAWNTGHPGGLTTLHANSALGALRRLEQLALEATPRMPHELIAEAIDVVVFMSRENGVRRVTEAIRVLEFDGGIYETEPLTGRSFSLIQQGASQ
ncbi:MAG: P-type conjugative transfer ATPase TrbB [Hyphomonadaceae bacterium]|nr:P-type conjugative transfer ATPase TrbB [Hyphomonadaceae bacterium]